MEAQVYILKLISILNGSYVCNHWCSYLEVSGSSCRFFRNWSFLRKVNVSFENNDFLKTHRNSCDKSLPKSNLLFRKVICMCSDQFSITVGGHRRSKKYNFLTNASLMSDEGHGRSWYHWSLVLGSSWVMSSSAWEYELMKNGKVHIFPGRSFQKFAEVLKFYPKHM